MCVGVGLLCTGPGHGCGGRVTSWSPRIRTLPISAAVPWIERFVFDEHRPPEARWFVASHSRRQHPDKRPGAFKPEVVETFRESGGLIIDTRALFAAVRHVQEHPASQNDVRAAFVSSMGLMHDFEIPAAAAEEA